jgi:tRNA A-37 threonylcarbamoyl transferase component Bud32
MFELFWYNLIVMSNVTFLNQPKLSGHTINQDQDERRTNLIPQIEEFLNTNNRFKGLSVAVTFFQAGASGLVSLLEAPAEKYVLKAILRPDGPKGEVEFLRIWENAGVRVPHVFEAGMIGEHPFILMEYIVGQSLELSTEAELLERKVFVQMGEILRCIDTTKAKGYGRMKVDGVGEYEDFKTWLLEFPQTVNQLAYIEKHNLLPEEIFGSLQRAKDILIEYIAADPHSAFCHWDFAPGNILDADSLVVIDPVPNFNHPYLDIARSIVQTIGAGYVADEVQKQFLEGYFSGEEKLNPRVLQAAVLFIAHTKIPHWHKTNEDKILEDVNGYLIRNKYLLE